MRDEYKMKFISFKHCMCSFHFQLLEGIKLLVQLLSLSIRKIVSLSPACACRVKPKRSNKVVILLRKEHGIYK